MISLLFAILTAGLLLVYLSRHRQQRAINVGLACVSLIVGLYLVEAVLEIVAIDPRRRAAWWGGARFDGRSRAEVVKDLRRRGVDAQPNVIPFGIAHRNGLLTGGGRLLPLAGISRAEVVFCNEAGPWVTYRADELGFRNPAGSHAPAEVDLVVLGDSFVQGECVDDGRDLVGWLRKRGYRAVSLGMSGNGPLIQLAGLSEYATRLRPAVVVWNIYEGNDAHELERERGSEILMRYLEPGFSQNLASRQNEIDRALRDDVEKRLARAPAGPAVGVRHGAGRFLRLRELERRLSGTLGRNPLPSETKPFPPLMSRILDQARRRVEGWGGRFYVSYLPDPVAGLGQEAIRRQTLHMVESLGIPLIDLCETLAGHPDPESLYPLGRRQRQHFNAEGYRLIAGALAARLPAAGDTVSQRPSSTLREAGYNSRP